MKTDTAYRFFLLIALSFAMTVGAIAKPGNHPMISSEAWGEIDGQKVTLYTLKNKNGLEVKISDYGGIIVSVLAPDKDGKLADVVLGFDGRHAICDRLRYRCPRDGV